MRDVSASIEEAWRTGRAVGDLRPVARVTVQHPKMRLRHFSLLSNYDYKVGPAGLDSIGDLNFTKVSKQRKVAQTYADFQFSNTGRPKELRNVKSVSWSRSIDSEVAECTVEIWNGGRTASGEEAIAGELSNPGYYTPTRGGSSFAARWGHEPNEWFGMLMPDNILRTYEGYGTGALDAELDIGPETDPNLVQTGVWIIDSVAMTDGGGFSIKCRDIGRILMEQMFWWPVVPKDFYNKDWENWDGTFPASVPGNRTRLKLTPQDSSNTPWIGSGTVSGHRLSYAFDGNPNTYWLSIGNDRPSRRYAYEWVQASVRNQTVSEVRVRPRKKDYTCYVSVKVGGVWQGSHTINYHEDGVGMNGADIHYVASTTLKSESWHTIRFKPIAKVQAIRVTFGNLQNFNIGTYHYRAGIRDVEAYGVSPATTKRRTLKHGPAGANPGRYEDYTDLVKLLCAWGGFFWPQGGKQRGTEGEYHTVSPTKSDPVLGAGVKGRVWGDFQQTGTSGPAQLGFENFDKKSLMDCIAYIRDILGFIFFIDETGGVQWRLPNIYARGNWRSTISANPGRTAGIVAIDETKTLLDLTANLDGANVREAYFVGVANALLEDGGTKLGAFAPGFNPNPTGLRRMAGWTDQNFQTQQECELMADMLSLRQLFTYRTDRIRIPGYPKIQIDDQVRIFERTTAEGHLHYIRGIASTLDMTSGEYFFDLDTHWLGEDPNAQWLFKPDQLMRTTVKYIEAASPDNSTPFSGPSRVVGE